MGVQSPVIILFTAIGELLVLSDLFYDGTVMIATLKHVIFVALKLIPPFDWCLYVSGQGMQAS